MKLTLSYPVNNPLITQRFGVNGEYYRANGVNVDNHNGTDLLAYHGQPVYAPMDGDAFYEIDDGGGHGVVIISDKVFEYKDTNAVFKVILWHFCDSKKEPKYASPIYLAVGKKANSGVKVPVKQGDLIGFADSTGLSTGDHVHFGLKPITYGKALSFGDAPDVGIGDWRNIEQNNGYLGAINPEPYFNGTFVSTSPIASTSYQFTRDLSLGVTGPDVIELQKYLNSHGFPIAPSPLPGSTGHETAYFGPATQKALIAFQKGRGITPPKGYLGITTRTLINKG